MLSAPQHLAQIPLIMRKSRSRVHMCSDDVIGAIFSNRDLNKKPIWRIQFQSNILTPITQRSYQIRLKMRWHLVDTDKTHPQYKEF